MRMTEHEALSIAKTMVGSMQLQFKPEQLIAIMSWAMVLTVVACTEKADTDKALAKVLIETSKRNVENGDQLRGMGYQPVTWDGVNQKN